MHKPDIVTPAGIRRAYRSHGGTPDQLRWNRQVIRGLTYMVTDKGPQAQWLKERGKVEGASCVCDGWTPQNAAHLYGCPWVGGGKGGTRGGAGTGPEKERGTWQQEAAVPRHSLDRLNTSNESKKKSLRDELYHLFIYSEGEEISPEDILLPLEPFLHLLIRTYMKDSQQRIARWI